MEYGDARLPDRFWSKVKVNIETGCWEWTASVDICGYGFISWEGKLRKAHRVMWQIVSGSWPGALHVRHVVCDNPPCVNPAHLAAGMHSDNMQDRSRAGRDRNVQKTHCPRGHAYDESNTAPIRPGQGRKCRTCNRERMRKRQ